MDSPASHVLALALAVIALGAAAQPLPLRAVWAWADGNPAAVAQWNNASWRGIFDGVQASCGMSFIARSADAVELVVNSTLFDACRPLAAAVRASGGLFQVWTPGLPPECLTSSAAAASAAASAAGVATAYDIDGFSIDDESDCAPRSTVRNFTQWASAMEQMAAALRGAGNRSLSAAVQAVFGIQDVPYAPLCEPPWDASCSQACHLPPWNYTPSAVVMHTMAASAVRWLEMDTYYFSTARFLNALDFYAGALPAGRFGVAMMNRADLAEDDYAARFHAIDRSGTDLVNIFMLPAADAWLPWLRKWKTRCAGCPNAGLLSCYEPALAC